MKSGTTLLAGLVLLSSTGCTAVNPDLAATELTQSPSPTETIDPAPVEVPLMPAVADTSLHLDAEQCKLFSVDDPAFLFTDINDRYKSAVGKQTHLFAFVNFDEFTPPESPAEWLELNASHLRDFVQANSYQKLEVDIESNSEWISIGESYDLLVNQGQQDKFSRAFDALDSTVDFSKYDGLHLVLGTHPRHLGDGTGAWNPGLEDALTYDGKVFRNFMTVTTGLSLEWGDFKPHIVTHEFLHTLGPADLYAFEATSYFDAFRFTGNVDLMGLASGSAPSLFGWTRWRFNWLEDSDIFCLDSGVQDTFLLNSIGSPEGPRLLVFGAGELDRLVIEFRPPDLEGLSYGGLLVYRVDDSPGGYGPIKVQGISEAPLVWGPKNYIGVGDKQCFDLACIELLQSNSEAAIVKVTLPED